MLSFILPPHTPWVVSEKLSERGWDLSACIAGVVWTTVFRQSISLSREREEAKWVPFLSEAHTHVLLLILSHDNHKSGIHLVLHRNPFNDKLKAQYYHSLLSMLSLQKNWSWSLEDARVHISHQKEYSSVSAKNITWPVNCQLQLKQDFPGPYQCMAKKHLFIRKTSKITAAIPFLSSANCSLSRV